MASRSACRVINLILILMLQLNLIGHLGADAKVVSANGSTFVSFNVAHTDKWVDPDGREREETTWVSCAVSRDIPNLLPFLVKGQQVFCSGFPSTRVFSSPKQRKMVAGLNLSVTSIQLVGAAPSPVPRQLYTKDGIILHVNKFFQLDADEVKAADFKPKDLEFLFASDGSLFVVNKQLWVAVASGEQVAQYYSEHGINNEQQQG